MGALIQLCWSTHMMIASDTQQMQQPLAYDVSEKSSSSSVGGRLAGPAFTCAGEAMDVCRARLWSSRRRRGHAPDPWRTSLT